MAPRIVTRAEWGALPENPARLSERAPTRLVGLTVHHTATSPLDPIGTWRQIQRDYLSGNNVNHERYGDTPYNDGITANGLILVGRAHHWKGAHARSARNIANEWTLGVAYVGDGDQLTDAARTALRLYVYLATLEIGHRPLLFDHNDWLALGGISTHCPGNALEAFVGQLRDEARHGK